MATLIVLVVVALVVLITLSRGIRIVPDVVSFVRAPPLTLIA